MHPCQPVTECLCFISPDTYFCILGDVWVPGDPKIPAKNAHTFVNGLAGTQRTRVQPIRNYLQKRCRHLDFYAENMSNLRSCLVITSKQLGVRYELILALRSQIFEYLRETFYRSTRNRPVQKKEVFFFLLKRLTIIDLVEGLWPVGTLFQHWR